MGFVQTRAFSPFARALSSQRAFALLLSFYFVARATREINLINSLLCMAKKTLASLCVFIHKAYWNSQNQQISENFEGLCMYYPLLDTSVSIHEKLT